MVLRGIRGILALLAVFGASVPAAQASLGEPPPQTFTSLAPFEAAIGGSDNGTVPGQRGSGFRHWTPAGTAVDGSDPGATAIPGGHTAALAFSRLQPWGIELGPAVALANDGFASVNSNASFSPPDLWAPFNSNTATLNVVAPAAQTSAAARTMTRGLGVTFVHVESSGTTISYYSGDGLLNTISVTPGAMSFAGELFRDPVVTRVVITLGTAEIFGYDGSTLMPGGATPSMLAAGDDIVLAEPGAGQATTAATAGVPVSSTFESFTSNDAAAEIGGTIDWGDGSRSSGAIVAVAAGAFAVSGSHSYAMPGTYTATVTVQDSGGSELTTQSRFQVAPRSTQTSVSCAPSDVAVSATTTCTARVQDASAGTPTAPTGLVAFSTPTPGASFPGTGSCVLGAGGPGSAFCQVQLKPGQRPPVQARITGSYAGDALHVTSSATTTVAVHVPRCTLKALARRLRAGGFGLLVTCDARSAAQIAVTALVARKGAHKAFQLSFGSLRSTVTAGRPTVLVIKPAPGVLPALRAALSRHQSVSLKLTVTAGSQATGTRTTTTRVSALRIS